MLTLYHPNTQKNNKARFLGDAMTKLGKNGVPRIWKVLTRQQKE